MKNDICIARLIEAGGGMERIKGWFSLRTFSPDRLAQGAVEDYGRELAGKMQELEQAGAAADQIEQWAAGYVKRWLAFQHAGARTANWMITGPARFPVERNRKRMEIERKRYDELAAYAADPIAWLNRQQRRAERAALSEQAQGQAFEEIEKAGVRLVGNTVLDRVQLVFPGKPDAEIRAEMKARAFRWSPREGAWQRQLTANGVRAAHQVLAKIAEQ